MVLWAAGLNGIEVGDGLLFRSFVHSLPPFNLNTNTPSRR